MSSTKHLLILSLLSTILISQIACKIDKERVLLAINCGGPNFEDSNGVTYIKDKFYDGGIRSDHGISYDIEGTADQDVYQTERWHSDTFTYSLPIKEEGDYVIILKFSEVYFTKSEEKVFDIALGRKTVIKNLDIFSVVGKLQAYDEYLEVTLKDG